MNRWKKRLLWISAATFFPVALYFLTAPFMVDYFWLSQGRAVEQTLLWKFYGPARAALSRDWFGESAYEFYCYKVCRMGLLLPYEMDEDDQR